METGMLLPSGVGIRLGFKKVFSHKRKRLKLQSLSLKYWSECGDLNSGPLGPEPSALPAALHPESFIIIVAESGFVKKKIQHFFIESIERSYYNIHAILLT